MKDKKELEDKKEKSAIAEKLLSDKQNKEAALNNSSDSKDMASVEKYRNVLENIHDGYFEVDLAGNFTFLNDSVCQSLGYSREELMNMKSPHYTADAETAENIFQAYHKVYKTGETLKDFHWQVKRKDGTTRYIEGSISLLKDSTGKPTGFLGIANDITDRKKAEESLRQSEEKYRSILDNIQDTYFEVDLAGNFDFFNESLCRLTGCSKDELFGENYAKFSDKENSKKVFQTFNKVYSTGKPTEGFDWLIIRKDGTKRYIEASVSLRKDSSSKPVGFRGIIRDITDRKQAQENLIRSEKKFASLFHLNPNPMAITDIATGKFIDINESFTSFSGHTREEALGASSLDINLWVDPRDREKMIDALARTKEVNGIEVMMRPKNGQIRSVLISARFIEIEQKRYLLTLTHDITERKQVEEKYRNIFENAQEGIYQSTPEGRFIVVNKSMARILGYESPEDVINSVTDIAHQLYIDPEERLKFTEAIETDGFSRDYEVKFKTKDGRIIWVSRTMQAICDENGQAKYYEGIIEDITERKEGVERLRNALAGTVRAIASIVETKDPYTAGHQRQVGDLARSIAAEMGLSSNRIEGLRVAAIIHDIGKISVPAEIMSKPSKLTEIEFDIIKTHSQSGFDILKDIDFPWPVAQIVIEHHERMDGSGYPNKLKGEEIILEARILAVADVVEAISSHRPYRPSLGLNCALEEIAKNKGKLYDPEVVDACLRLFNEKNYKIKS